MKGIRRHPCYCCCITTTKKSVDLQARTASNLANVFYGADHGHIHPEVLVLLIPHFSKGTFDLTVQINVLPVVGSDVWQEKIGAINITYKY